MLAIIPFSLFLFFPEFRDGLMRHLLEETAECSEVFKAEDVADLLCTHVGVDHQTFGFGTEAFVNDAQWRWQFVHGKEIGQSLR